jgi:hypothetical protein
MISEVGANKYDQASRYMYNQSLFVRMQKQRPDAVHLLRSVTSKRLDSHYDVFAVFNTECILKSASYPARYSTMAS